MYFREYRCRNGLLENRIYSGLNSLYVDLYYLKYVHTNICVGKKIVETLKH